jgi:dephospho-CoA kinase
VIIVGLTGGIGSGKSTVSTALVERGAVLVDADAVTRDLQQPGQPVFDGMVERLGEGIVSGDGTLDRPAVAAIVFGDEEALRDLGKIVHPVVNFTLRERLRRLADSGKIIILDVPLLVEGRREDGTLRYPTSGVLVVDTPIDTAVARLVAHRGFGEDDARARLAKQATREDRWSIADFVIDNGGRPEELPVQIERAWVWAEQLPDVDAPVEPAPGEEDEPIVARR